MESKIRRVFRTRQCSVLGTLLREYCDTYCNKYTAGAGAFQRYFTAYFNPSITYTAPAYFEPLVVSFLGHYGLVDLHHKANARLAMLQAQKPTVTDL